MTKTGRSRALDESVSRLTKLAAERESTQEVQLPLWPDEKRGTPNTFLRSALFSAVQGKDRIYVEDQPIAGQDGFSVRYTGQQLNQDDLTLWETLVHLAKENPLGTECNFTAHGLLKAMRKSTGGAEHERLHKGILRLKACAVEIKFDYQGRPKKYAGSLIESPIIKDEISNQYQLMLNRELIRLYGESHWTALDWEQRQQLRRKPLAQALHGYYSSHRTPFPVKLATLQTMTGSRNEQAASFKRQCRTALQELVKVGFLAAFDIEGDLVSVTRNASLCNIPLIAG